MDVHVVRLRGDPAGRRSAAHEGIGPLLVAKIDYPVRILQRSALGIFRYFLPREAYIVGPGPPAGRYKHTRVRAPMRLYGTVSP